MWTWLWTLSVNTSENISILIIQRPLIGRKMLVEIAWNHLVISQKTYCWLHTCVWNGAFEFLNIATIDINICKQRKSRKVCFHVHYIDVIMTTMASQITSLTVVHSTVYSDADQLRRKCFHMMTSSWMTKSCMLGAWVLRVMVLYIPGDVWISLFTYNWYHIW